ERQLIVLADACRQTGHELLLEIIASGHGAVDSQTVSSVIERSYNIGLKPDWWKIEPSSEPAAWRNIQDTIAHHDPLCRGIVVLGLSASVEHLIASFKSVASFPLVKGFAVGRTIFNEPARQWLSGSIDDEAAIEFLAKNLRVLVDG